MTIWQSDFYHYPKTEPQWQLVICSLDGKLVYEALCNPSQVNATWLTKQIKQAAQEQLPSKIQIFRPQIVGLFQVTTQNLNIELETTRRTITLKEKLQDYFLTNSQSKLTSNQLALEVPPPKPLPENIWGDNWSFVSIKANDIIRFTNDHPIPIKNIPQILHPANLGIEPDNDIPGIIVYGGRKSLALARWIGQQQPIALNYIPTEIGKSGGLVLESGLVDRWIFATFESDTVAKAAKNYEQQKQISLGLHFLLIQPDDSGMTYTGIWLLSN